MSSRTPVLDHRTSIRSWPAVAAAILLIIFRFALPAATPEIFGMDTGLIGLLGSIACLAFALVWLLFFSRVPWAERLGGVAVIIAAAMATMPLTHQSIQGGMMGGMFFIYAVPLSLTLALAAWAVASRHLDTTRRRIAMVLAIVIGTGAWTLARTDGLLGSSSLLRWRWTPTAEEQLLAREAKVPAPVRMQNASTAPATPPPSVPAEISDHGTDASAPIPAPEPTPDSEEVLPAAIKPTPADERAITEAEWPGFRGTRRDSVIRGLRVQTDWSSTPPTELWRRPIGPGWSSFAVMGDLVYTQEQRGDDEIVSCYRLSTGEPVWQHRDRVRFWESNGGPGPRATPTVHDSRIYAMGATGIVNALDARSGAVIWSRNAASDTGKTIPDWGFASSPIVVDDVVIVAAAGQLAGYDIDTGVIRWMGETGGGGYSSPHLLTIDGVPQVVLLRGARTISVKPSDGTLLWAYTTGKPAASIVQPGIAGERDILLSSADGMTGNGIRRIALAHDGGRWTVEEKWESRGLKPYFNDFVVHKGHAYGFDGSILSAIDLGDGTRRWKGGRYGNGQMLLLAEQDLLLVISEEGELALVSATPDSFQEIARFPVFEAKTWNHPVIVGNVLLVRNGEEMAAFRLPEDTTR